MIKLNELNIQNKILKETLCEEHPLKLSPKPELLHPKNRPIQNLAAFFSEHVAKGLRTCSI